MHDVAHRKIVKHTETIQGTKKTIEVLSSKYENLLNCQAQENEIKDLKEKQLALRPTFWPKMNEGVSSKFKWTVWSTNREKETWRFMELHIPRGKTSTVLSPVANKLKLNAPCHEDIAHRVKDKAGVIPPIPIRLFIGKK